MQPDQYPSSTWWRWPFLPLVSVAAAGITSFVVSFALVLAYRLFEGELPGTNTPHYAITVLVYATFGYVLALTAFSWAPSRKLIAGTAMTGAMFAFMTLAYAVAHAAGAEHSNLLARLTAGIPSATLFAAVTLICLHKGAIEPI